MPENAIDDAVRTALAPYVKAGHITPHEISIRLRDTSAAVRDVRSLIAAGRASRAYYDRKIAEADQRFRAATSAVTREFRVGFLIGAECYRAVYLALRAHYLTPDELQADDGETAPAAARPLPATD